MKRLPFLWELPMIAARLFYQWSAALDRWSQRLYFWCERKRFTETGIERTFREQDEKWLIRFN